MKKHALSWLTDRLTPKPATPFVDPVVHQIGYSAVAEALATSDTLETTFVDPKAGEWEEPASGPSSVVVAPVAGSPEHNLMLIEKLIDSLTTRINKASTKRADQRKAYDDDKHQRALEQERSDQEQATEIAGLSKSLAAYTAARDVLNPPTPGASGYTVDPTVIADRPKRRKAVVKVTAQREAFTVPEGHEAVRDAEGKATGETRPIHVNPSDRDGDKMS